MFIVPELWLDCGNGCAAGEIKLCVSRHWMHLGSKVERDKVSPKIHSTAAVSMQVRLGKCLVRRHIYPSKVFIVVLEVVLFPPHLHLNSRDLYYCITV